MTIAGILSRTWKAFVWAFTDAWKGRTVRSSARHPFREFRRLLALRAALKNRPQIEHARRARAIAVDMESTADAEVVLARDNHGFGALLEDTGEFPVVLVSTDKRPGESEAHAAEQAARRAERERAARIKVDALGEWDPTEADWSAPALIFEATALQRMSTMGRLANADDRLAVAGQVAAQLLGVSW